MGEFKKKVFNTKLERVRDKEVNLLTKEIFEKEYPWTVRNITSNNEVAPTSLDIGPSDELGRFGSGLRLREHIEPPKYTSKLGYNNQVYYFDPYDKLNLNPSKETDNNTNLNLLSDYYRPYDHMMILYNNDGTFNPCIRLVFNFNSKYFNNYNPSDKFIDSFIKKNIYYLIYNLSNNEYSIINKNDIKNLQYFSCESVHLYMSKFFDFYYSRNNAPLVEKTEVNIHNTGFYKTYELYENGNLEINFNYPDRNVNAIIKPEVLELIKHFTLPELKIIKSGDRVSFFTEKGINLIGRIVDKDVSHSPNIWIIEDELGNTYFINKKQVKKLSNEK